MIDAVEIEDIAANFDPNGTQADKVRVAQDLINTAIEILSDVVRETDDQYAKTYVVDHLAVLAGDDHGFMSRDMNLDDWISRLEK